MKLGAKLRYVSEWRREGFGHCFIGDSESMHLIQICYGTRYFIFYWFFKKPIFCSIIVSIESIFI